MSSFTGRDCLSENFEKQMDIYTIKCIYNDKYKTTNEEHVQFETQNTIKEIDNYPKIISKYFNATYKTCLSNINDLNIENDYKVFYSNIYEKITSIIALFNVNEIIYDALLHNLRNKLKTFLIKYENKYLVKYNNMYYDINDIQGLSIVNYIPTQKDNHKKLIVPSNIPEIKTYYDINSNPKKIFNNKSQFTKLYNKDIFPNYSYELYDDKDNILDVINKLEHISKLINIDDIIDLFKDFLLDIILSDIKVYRFYNNNTSQDILYYKKLLNETMTIKVNGFDCPVRYIGYNIEVSDFVIGKYDNLFIYTIGDIKISYDGIDFKIVNITNKYIEYTVDEVCVIIDANYNFNTFGKSPHPYYEKLF